MSWGREPALLLRAHPCIKLIESLRQAARNVVVRWAAKHKGGLRTGYVSHSDSCHTPPSQRQRPVAVDGGKRQEAQMVAKRPLL